MQPAPLHPDFNAFSKDPAQRGIPDAVAEKNYDDLAGLLAQATGCPVALISFFDGQQQWLKAVTGLQVKTIPVEESLCIVTMVRGALTVVPDTTADDRFNNKPLVTGPEHIRFYAGVPVRSPLGQRIGTVCIMNRRPLSLQPEGATALNIVARQVEVLLDLELKNQQLQQWAKEKEQLDKATIQRQILQHEEEREFIGYELHENFAQTITASIQFLDLVNGATEPDQLMIDRTRRVLSDLLNGVRQLSSAVFPIGRAGVMHEAIFEQYVVQFSANTGIPVDFAHEGPIGRASAAKLLTLFRIMVEQLQTFERRPLANLRISILLAVYDDIRFSIATEGEVPSAHREERRVVVNGIINRSLLHQGHFTSHTDEAENEIMTVHLPL